MLLITHYLFYSFLSQNPQSIDICTTKFQNHLPSTSWVFAAVSLVNSRNIIILYALYYYTLCIRIFKRIESGHANNEFQFSTSFTLDAHAQKRRAIYLRAGGSFESFILSRFTWTNKKVELMLNDVVLTVNSRFFFSFSFQTALHTGSGTQQQYLEPRMAQLETLEAKVIK